VSLLQVELPQHALPESRAAFMVVATSARGLGASDGGTHHAQVEYSSTIP
jgi:hypothetical protein